MRVPPFFPTLSTVEPDIFERPDLEILLSAPIVLRPVWPFVDSRWLLSSVAWCLRFLFFLLSGLVLTNPFSNYPPRAAGPSPSARWARSVWAFTLRPPFFFASSPTGGAVPGWFPSRRLPFLSNPLFCRVVICHGPPLVFPSFAHAFYWVLLITRLVRLVDAARFDFSSVFLEIWSF